MRKETALVSTIHVYKLWSMEAAKCSTRKWLWRLGKMGESEMTRNIYKSGIEDAECEQDDPL